MLRKALFIVALAGLACGSHDSSTSGTTGSDTPPVSAVQPAEGGAAPTAEAVSCLELVEVGKYAEAVVICETATQQDPSNTAVATALAKAGAATAAQGAAGAASAAAGNAAAATGEAIDSAAEATKDAVGAGEEKATE